ncbi:unnamed protein product [Parnassius apollo]|uniref:(apollo) hypothetical protein n=1 Tax=Parnassius apollo TaxID=110799 RepID=A0A8S3WVZ6_PARAO|nr:unnamed protein product [Parnassius apollo]
MLQKFTNTQEATMNFIRDNITEMKTQVNNIKVATDTLNKDQISMKVQISDITTKATAADNKIQSLEAEIVTLKNNMAFSTTMSTSDENVIQELQERFAREKNIIVVGIRECKTTKIDEGRAYDFSEVSKTINSLIQECPKPSRVFRLGKYQPTKDRSIKVLLRA